MNCKECGRPIFRQLKIFKRPEQRRAYKFIFRCRRHPRLSTDFEVTAKDLRDELRELGQK